MIATLFTNPEVQAVLIFGVGWLAKKVIGKRADSRMGRAVTALAISAEQMLQYALTEPGKTPSEVLVAFKGIVAIQFAKVGLYEADRILYQPLIDAAISKAVTSWVKAHPDPTALTMPVTKTLAA